jgi:phytoene dehydrogenase-like protein
VDRIGAMAARHGLHLVIGARSAVAVLTDRHGCHGGAPARRQERTDGLPQPRGRLVVDRERAEHLGDPRPDGVTAAIESQIEQFAPGFRDRILARHVRTTVQMEDHNPNFVGGDVVTGADSARQLVFRPRVAINPYGTGVPGVYLCSAATPPGAGAHGMCGYNAARAALAWLR